MARMVRRRFGIPAAFALICTLSSPIVQAGSDDPKEPAQAPVGILVYSKDGSDSLQGFCRDEGRYTVCDVTEVRIIPPNIKRADDDERNMLQEFKKDPEKAKKEFIDVAADLKKTTEKVRSDPSISPKVRRNFDEMLAAAEAHDVERWAHAAVESDRHTCHLWTSNYQLKFHRVGPRKWVTDAEPEGLCRIVNVWEMTADDEHAGLLTLVQHTVAVGNPGGGVMGLCPKSVKEAEDPTPLSWSGKKQFEPQPPCDFISPTL